jgi:hypothetical protein
LGKALIRSLGDPLFIIEGTGGHLQRASKLIGDIYDAALDTVAARPEKAGAT